MALFFVTADNDTPELGEKIVELYPNDHFVAVPDRQWFVSADKLTNQLRDELGINGGTYGRALVIKSEKVSGWYANSIWEWLKLKEGQ